MQGTLAIEATGLVKSFGDVRAVDGVDLAVRTGSVYGVLGPNGAGKTTTIRMLATLLRPDAGSARVLGHDIVEEADAVRGAVSLTGQLASVDEDLTGRENLILIGRLLGLKRAAAKDARDRAARGVRARRGRQAGSSRTTRAACGAGSTSPRASSSRRELMFLDEPTTGLDPRSRNQVWDIIRALVAEGTTILLCTQYLEEADQLADGIAVIDHGKVIAEGTPGQLKASVGSGALHVRLLDPEQRPEAERVLARELGARCTSSPTRPRSRPPAPTPTGRAEAVAELAALRRADRRLLARPAEPRRGLPRPHRPPGRGATGRSASPRGGAGGMSADPTTDARRTPAPTRPRSARRSPRPRARRGPAPLSAALTFGWRGMLKVKHVPEQLLDVTITPVMFVLMFTYLFGGAIAGSTGEYLDYILPGILVMSVLFTTVYSGRRAQHRPDQGRRRPLPLAADLAPGAAGRRRCSATACATCVAGTVIIVLGVILGYRPDAGVGGVVAALALVVVFAFGLSWVFTTLGLLLRSPNAVMNAGFMAIFPLTFLSQRLRRADTLPARARGVRRRQPDLDPGDGLPRPDGGRRRGRRHRIVLGVAPRC